jgi:hypothetical protein
MREIDENVRIRALEIIRLLRNPPHLADEEVSAPLSLDPPTQSVSIAFDRFGVG